MYIFVFVWVEKAEEGAASRKGNDSAVEKAEEGTVSRSGDTTKRDGRKVNKQVQCKTCNDKTHSTDTVNCKSKKKDEVICRACAFPTCPCCGAKSVKRLSPAEARRYNAGDWYR